MLWADVCDGLPTRPRKVEDLFGSNEPRSFKLSVTSGGTAYRITVRPLWRLTEDHHLIPYNDDHGGDIEVARCQDGGLLQVLPITPGDPIDFGSTFQAEDLNLDGYLDFSVITETSGTGGDLRSYWVYDPSSGIFVQNEFTRDLRCGSVETNGGACWGQPSSTSTR
jgi:hypothetical protein